MGQDNHDTCDSELFNTLRFVSDVCSRLDAWAEKPTTAPSITFAQDFIKRLVVTVRAFEQEIRDGYHSSGPGVTESQDDKYWPVSILESVHRVHDSIQLAVGILSFCDHFEFTGEEGALNAVFFAQGGRMRNLHDASEREQLAREVTNNIGSLLGLHAAARNHTWGRDVPESCNPADWADFRESMRSCVTKIAKTFSPRYVHVYDTEGDTPYDIDTSISPCAGSYGVVQKVKQKVTKETFARKTYRNVFSSKERKAVLNELGVLEICFHPNIVTLVEAYEVTHEPYTINLVMSPWAPITLEDFLYTAGPKRKELFAWFEPNKTSSDKRIYNIMLGLAKAVHYLHGLSIKHKDIKPDNILLHVEKDQVVPYLTDVGVSKVYYRGAKTNYDQSTYTFLSPEQLEHRESSLKADIWQLGCCFAMLLALVRGGQQGVLKLHVSYRRTDERCSCNIALELDWFMGALKELCASGTAEQQHIQWMIGQMLDVNSLTRFDIERVIKELTKALEI